MLVTSQKNGCYHRIGYLTERLKTQCLSQKSEIVSVAQWIERCPPKECIYFYPKGNGTEFELISERSKLTENLYPKR